MRRSRGTWVRGFDAIALERGLTLVIDVRRFGQPLFYAALDGTTPDNVEWVRRKSNVVARFHRSSYADRNDSEDRKVRRCSNATGFRSPIMLRMADRFRW